MTCSDFQIDPKEFNFSLVFNFPDADFDEVVEVPAVNPEELETQDYLEEARDFDEADIEALIAGGALEVDDQVLAADGAVGGDPQLMEGTNVEEPLAQSGNFEMSPEDMQVCTK